MFCPAHLRPVEQKTSKTLLVTTFLTLTLLTSCSSLPDQNQFELSAASGKQSGDVSGIGGDEAFEKKELQKAVTYWGQQYVQNPRDPGTAINYAHSLKQIGHHSRAFAVLESAHKSDPKNRELSSEYGRIAIQVGKIALAEELLNKAGGYDSDDWKTVSAKGVLLSKRGDYKGAQQYFKRALDLKPHQPSVISNLAMSYALVGKPELAEKYIRRASELAPNNKQVQQNLALILGIRGNFEEAETIASRSVPSQVASANIAYLQSLIKSPEERWITKTNKSWTAQTTTTAITKEKEPLQLKKTSYPSSTDNQLASAYNN